MIKPKSPHLGWLQLPYQRQINRTQPPPQRLAGGSEVRDKETVDGWSGTGARQETLGAVSHWDKLIAFPISLWVSHQRTALSMVGKKAILNIF
jgi:hypothetical protein